MTNKSKLTLTPTTDPQPSENPEARAQQALSRRQVLTGGAAGLAGLALSGIGLAGAPTGEAAPAGRFTDRVVLITGAVLDVATGANARYTA